MALQTVSGLTSCVVTNLPMPAPTLVERLGRCYSGAIHDVRGGMDPVDAYPKYRKF
ncbi:MAG: hypothetical protein IPO58_18690 [Betaproteobacteria bacterium]|nr:hypothetical protein [Betaproteobacteria bacterium]